MGMELMFRRLAEGERSEEVFEHLPPAEYSELVSLLTDHSNVISLGVINIWRDTLSGRLRKRVERIAQIAFLSEDEVQKTTLGINLILVRFNVPSEIYDMIQQTTRTQETTGNELADKKIHCIHSLSLLWAAILWVHKQERLKKYM